MVKGIAIWKQIEQALLKDITAGTYEPGHQLPTEHQLATRFGVNRHTVRRAISSLVDQGRLRVDQGRGTFVREQTVEYPVGRRVRFTQSVAAAHRLPNREILRAEIVRCDQEAADALKIALGSKVVVIQSLGAVDGKPLSYGVSQFPADRFAGLIPHVKETRSITVALARLGIEDYTRASTRISAIAPTAELSRHLQIPYGRPILQTEGVDIDSNGEPISLNVSQFAGDRIQLVVEAGE
ncbi:phosphonate metabolism transcriptional regulator PhnF [Hwanghaeella sp.]|uniref:phosphonate metabolism transcriptional regulator PhnF n=1 Tax=Hwanghaeella sp. TaxID=2605943 RepID=UPI003CCB8944